MPRADHDTQNIRAQARGRVRRVYVCGKPSKQECPVGSDYCSQCGTIAPGEEFDRQGQCPNPRCVFPHRWED
jgi:hypothetical protein